jgi:hypothetical protein
MRNTKGNSGSVCAIILILTLFSLVIASCTNDTVNISKEEYNKLKTGEVQRKYPKPFELLYTENLNFGDKAIILGSDKHEYLITNFGWQSENIEHYIECELCYSRGNYSKGVKKIQK